MIGVALSQVALSDAVLVICRLKHKKSVLNRLLKLTLLLNLPHFDWMIALKNQRNY
jgi:hypothetical protein